MDHCAAHLGAAKVGARPARWWRRGCASGSHGRSPPPASLWEHHPKGPAASSNAEASAPMSAAALRLRMPAARLSSNWPLRRSHSSPMTRPQPRTTIGPRACSAECVLLVGDREGPHAPRPAGTDGTAGTRLDDRQLCGFESRLAKVGNGSVAGAHERPLTGIQSFWLGAHTPPRGDRLLSLQCCRPIPRIG
jgi:hypothetical protein